jgi:hypothetical protein
LTSPDQQLDPEQYIADVQKVCDTYQQVAALQAQGTRVACIDEKTGIQALERIHPTKPVKPGMVERIEFEYKRHGTLCLIASFDVATGEVLAPTIGATRTEEDFVAHIGQTINTEPQASWVFVVDQLNTHMSEGLVQLVASMCSIDPATLGTKGRDGVQKTMASRRAFLEDDSHRVRFVYTPRHCSWLNQVEIWFSILARRALKRASFCSLAELERRLRDFIRYFNSVLAKPFKWTYTGRPLAAT